METVIWKLPTNKNPGPDGFTGEFYQTLNIYPSETLLKTAEEGILPSHSTRPLSPGYQNHTKTSHAKKKRKRKLKANITDEHRCKNLQQNTSKLNLKTH